MATTAVEHRTRAPAPPRRRRPRAQPVAYAFLAPWLAGALLLTLGPMLVSLYLSFTDYNLFTAPEWVGLDNYAGMLDDPRYLASVTATLQYVLLATPVKLAAALGVALLLHRATTATGFFRSAFYAPSLLGASVSVALVWRALFDDDGSVDQGLQFFGIDSPGWANQPTSAVVVLVLLSVWQFGAPMVIFLAGLQQIPTELYDAAAVDGAGRVRTFAAVTLPMLSPVLLFNLVLETIHSFQAFTGAFVISNGTGGPADSTLFYTLYLYQRGFSDFDMGYASAMAWVLLLVVGLVTALIFRTARLWVFYSGEDA